MKKFLNINMLKNIVIGVFILTIMFSTTVFAGNDWGLHYPKPGERPRGNATAEYLAQFDAFFIGAEDEKVLYLTFDAGYENNLTEGVLDTLKSHKVPAAFFLVGTYIKKHPELVSRMVAEGHIVANHTMTHPDMSAINNKEIFVKELSQVEEHYREITGKDLPKFYRPPKGVFSEANLKLAKELGYKTIFWSTAYKDWEDNNQPSKEEAFSKLIPRLVSPPEKRANAPLNTSVVALPNNFGLKIANTVLAMPKIITKSICILNGFI